MRKKRVFILTLIMMCLLTVNGFAENIDSASNYIGSSQDVNIPKAISGDVYTAGKDISINEKVGGDVLAAGETININGEEVSGNIRTLSKTLNINAKNIKNITSAAQRINFGDKTTARGIYLTGENINFKGECKGFSATGKTIIINGKVDGDLNVDCEELIIANKGDISGKINVKASKEPILNSKIKMEDINYTKVARESNKPRIDVFGIFIGIIASIVLAIIIYSIFKKQIMVSENLLIDKPLPIMLSGIGALILLPIVSVLLLITVIGIPLALIILVMYGILIYISPVVTGIVVGRVVLKNKNPYLQLLLGVFGIRLLTLLPSVGWFVWVVSSIIVLGLLMNAFYKSIKYKEKTIIE